MTTAVAPDSIPLASTISPEISDTEIGGLSFNFLHKKRKFRPMEKDIIEEESVQVPQVKRRYSPSNSQTQVEYDDKDKETDEQLVNLDSTLSPPSDSDDTQREENKGKRQLYESLSSRNEEVQELRKQLEGGSYEDSFTYRFWRGLRANHGLFAGYLMGFLLIFLMQYEWMYDEFGEDSEGHSVSKTVVILFLFYGYSFITLGMEVIQSVILCTAICCPGYIKEVKEELEDLLPQLTQWKSSKYFYPILAVFWCMVNAAIGTLFWTWFWWNHVCKSYHDKTCKNSWIGKWIISHRDEACFDGTTTSIVCEKLISYCPIMILTVIVVFLANVMLPLLNDFLCIYVPPSEDHSSLCEIMDRLEEENGEENNADCHGMEGNKNRDNSVMSANIDPDYSEQNELGGPETEEDEIKIGTNFSFSTWKKILLLSAFSLILLELLAVVNYTFSRQ